MKRIMLMLATLLAAAGVSLAPMAQAETADAAYLRLLEMEHLGAEDSVKLIRLGHSVCDALAAGNPESKVIAALRTNMPALVNASDPYVAAMVAGSIAGAAQYAYCPNV